MRKASEFVYHLETALFLHLGRKIHFEERLRTVAGSRTFEGLAGPTRACRRCNVRHLGINCYVSQATLTSCTSLILNLGYLFFKLSRKMNETRHNRAWRKEDRNTLRSLCHDRGV